VKKLLFVSLFFPPFDYDSSRQVKIAKYLPARGWEARVLTVKETVLRSRCPSSLPEDSPFGIRVFRTGTFENKKFFLDLPAFFGKSPYDFWAPDFYAGWVPFAVRKGLEILRKERISAILSSSLPSTSHCIAYLLKKKTGLPWIADFRDSWTRNPYRSYPVPLSLPFDRGLEKRVMAVADRIVTVTDSLTREFREVYEEKVGPKFSTITSGFDPEDFASFREAPIPREAPWTLSYSGNLYGHRRADTFLEAVRELLAENPSLKSNIRIHFTGLVDPAEELRKRFGLEETVQTFPQQSHRELLARLSGSDAFLILSGPKEIDRQALPRKLFDYLALRKPILALIPEGETSKVIREAKAGISVHPEDKAGIRKALKEMLEYRNGGPKLFSPDFSVIERFDIRRSAEKLAAILEELTG